MRGLPCRPDGGELIAIVGGTLHPITAPDVEGGTLLVQDGHIVDMGRDLAVPAGARVIDATGEHVWPGLIALSTSIGLREIGSVRGTLDDSEIGGNQPDLRVSSAIHIVSSHVPVTRSNGITRSQTAPQGGGPMQVFAVMGRCLANRLRCWWSRKVLRLRRLATLGYDWDGGVGGF